MKKTLLVLALATMLVFVFAGSAFAVANASGQQRLGAAAIAPATVASLTPDQTNPVAGAGTLIYQDWSRTSWGNAAPNAGNSPHGNYTTTTVKCVVCHAVHYAAPGGAPVGQGQAADTLLRMRASDSCVYCHATAGVAVNGRPVYNGLGMPLLTPSNTGGSTLTGHETQENCSMCHTSVHGVGQDTSVASLNGYLLISLTNAAGYATSPVAQPSNIPPATNVESAIATVTTTNMLDAIKAIDKGAVNQGFDAGDALGGTIAEYANVSSTTLREQAVGVFCAECHNGAYATVAAGAATNVNTSADKLYSGHRIAAAATDDWNGEVKVSSSALSGITVAWAAADNCKSCHDALDNFNRPGFPHAWGKFTLPSGNAATDGAKMWLTSAATAGQPTTPLVPTTTPFSAGLQLQDGVCLKCHVAPGGTAGVGRTF